MNPNDSSTPQPPKKENIEVPRDEQLEGEPGSENVPPEGRRTTDEFMAQDQRGLVEDSPVAKALHERPPQGADQLTTGSGGDAARPGKEGIFGKPIPPRGTL